jgi:NADH:quinone reductase (non-electrogenic)
MKRIVIVGGGYAGFYTALGLERRLKKSDEAELTLIDPQPYMTYEPFLPEIASGSIEPRHCLVPLRKTLRNTRVLSGSVAAIVHRNKSLVVRPHIGDDYSLHYDIIVVTAGAVSRSFAVAGLEQRAIGLKHVEEAIQIRDRLLTSLDRAARLPIGRERTRLLSAVVVGGGFSGVEVFGELLSLAASALRYYPELNAKELDFRLVQADRRILPEMSERLADCVTSSLEKRGARVHLNSQVVSAVHGNVVLSTGHQFETDLIVWAAGNEANPLIARHTDLPIDSRGFLMARADLRVGTKDSWIEDAWAAGDNASVPDLSGESPTGRVLPNAQNAVRQAHLLSVNVVASLRSQPAKQYYHRNLGTVATLGQGRGAFQSRRFGFAGTSAWLIHRAYHLYAMPTWERRMRILAGWLVSAAFGRDMVPLEDARHPRAVFFVKTLRRNCARSRDHEPDEEVGRPPSSLLRSIATTPNR